MYSQILVNLPDVTFHENQFGCCRVVTCWQKISLDVVELLRADRRTDMAKLIDGFLHLLVEKRQKMEGEKWVIFTRLQRRKDKQKATLLISL
jgi:hypothetical protein